jgi:cytochrome c-type biogenesis protein CcmH/NrfG
MMTDFGEDHPEVGDCYSLLGRTHLFSGRLKEAKMAYRHAERLILDEHSKEYLWRIT